MASVRHIGLFPFCISDLNGLSPEVATAVFWRVKSWRVSSVSSNLEGFEPPVGLILEPRLSSAVEDEKGLVCKTFMEYEGDFSTGDPMGIPLESLLIAIGSYEQKFGISVGTGVSEIVGSLGALTGGETGDGSLAGTATFQLGFLSESFNFF